MGEVELIVKLTARVGAPRTPGAIGIGHDCAALPDRDGYLLLKCDIAVEGRHFVRGLIPGADIGWRIATATASDIAASGGRPVAALVSLGVPRDCPERDLEDIYDGLAEAARAYGFDVLGGNVSGANELFIDVFMTGRGRRFLPRSGAQPGDLLVLSGPLGDSAAGLEVLRSGGSLDHPLAMRHRRPKARLDLVDALQASVHACIDISDGLSTELNHLAKASGACLTVERQRIPVSAALRAHCAQTGKDPVDYALSGGEDYELLFAVPRGGSLQPGGLQPGGLQPGGLQPGGLQPFGGLGTRVIGEVLAGSGVLLDGKPLAPTGWDHLRSRP